MSFPWFITFLSRVCRSKIPLSLLTVSALYSCYKALYDLLSFELSKLEVQTRLVFAWTITKILLFYHNQNTKHRHSHTIFLHHILKDTKYSGISLNKPSKLGHNKKTSIISTKLLVPTGLTHSYILISEREKPPLYYSKKWLKISGIKV